MSRTSSIQPVTIELVEKDVRQFLGEWHIQRPESCLNYLLIIRAAMLDRRISPRDATRTVLLRILDNLEPDYPDSVLFLRLRFVQGDTLTAVAHSMNRSQSTAYRDQQRAINHLARAIYDEEIEARERQHETMSARLESSSYDRLIGVEEALDELSALLFSPHNPYLILLEGLGGIGKTALADAVTRRMILQDHFDDVAWVSAQPQRFYFDGQIRDSEQFAMDTDMLIMTLGEQLFDQASRPIPFTVDAILPALQERFRIARHLVVIDNLETLADVETLIPILNQFGASTKLLLTARVQLRLIPDIYDYPVPELGVSAVLELLRHEARRCNERLLLAASDNELLPIYQAVGGNPLALRLVVGQVTLHGLTTVLDDLEQARGHSVQQLYTYIYRRSWDSLNDNAQTVLLAMPLAPPSGCDLEILSTLTQLESTDLHDAVEVLVKTNLLNRVGDLHHTRYTIHSLTRTFLHEQILQWQMKQ